MPDRRLYNEDAWLYDVLHPQHSYSSMAGFVLKQVPDAKRILDVGCGTANLRAALRELGFSGAYLGIDRHRGIAAVARAKGTDILLGTLEAVPARGPFDAICCTYGVIQYARSLAEIVTTMDSWRAMLNAHGAIIIDVVVHDRVFVPSVRMMTRKTGTTELVTFYQWRQHAEAFSGTAVNFYRGPSGEVNLSIDSEEALRFDISELVRLLHEKEFDVKIFAGYSDRLSINHETAPAVIVCRPR